MTSIDQFSLTTTPIEQFFNKTELGTATGFVWTIGGEYYLITNWHVVTSRTPIHSSGMVVSHTTGRLASCAARSHVAAALQLSAVWGTARGTRPCSRIAGRNSGLVKWYRIMTRPRLIL